MRKPENCQRRILLASFVFVVVLLAAGPTGTLAAYRYHFQFDALESALGDFPADEFSFVSPGLIGPGTAVIPGSPFIASVTLTPPGELNGFTFDTVEWESASFDGMDMIPETMFGVAFSTPENWGGAEGAIGDFFVGVSFATGTYGPGVYTSESFGRAIVGDGWMSYAYTTGTLTIEAASVVPAPGALLLGTLGTGLAGWLRRRRTL